MDKIESIRQAAEEYSNVMTGKLGVGFQDQRTGESFFLNGPELFPTASVFKIFVLAELYRQADQGRVTLDQRYALEKSCKSVGSGVLFHISEGSELTLHDYATLMMIISDNTSADFLLNLVGKDEVRRNVLDQLGLANTRVDLSCSELFQNYCETSEGQSKEEALYHYYHGDFRGSDWYACKTGRNDVTTPEEVTKMLDLLDRGQWSSQKACDSILDIMKKCQTNSRIPKYLPVGTVTAHKTGTFDRVANDVGIVFTDRGRYILSLLYNGNLADKKEFYGKNARGFWGDEMLAQLSRRIYDIYLS